MVFEIGTDGPSSILVGIDGSPTSLRAGAYAAGMARREGAHLHVVFVRTVSGVAFVPQAVVAERESQDSAIAELRAAAEEQAALRGLTYTIHERAGNPFTEIVHLADELRVDAVVVGASAQAGHKLVGSLATHLVREARWPVTVVP